MSEPTAPITVIWDNCTRADWDSLVASAPACPFEQSWLYGAASAQRSVDSVHRAVVVQHGKPVAFGQILGRRVAGIVTLAQVLRGPVLLDDRPGPDTVTRIFERFAAACRTRKRQFLFWTPELTPGESTDTLMRSCGMRRILTGYGSVCVDLSQEETALRQALHGKWRNALVRAETSGLEIELSSDSNAMPWLLARYGTQRPRKPGLRAPIR